MGEQVDLINNSSELSNVKTEYSLKNSEDYKSGLELSRSFYEEYGIPMIKEKFPQYEGEIAAGLVGEGSECFGFDDAYSLDHDFGPGFCLWITDALYSEIGEELQKEYDNLPKTYKGITRIETKKAGKRVGVFRIGDFYDGIIGLKDAPTSINQWLFLDDYRLATASNGEVFRDDLGEFTRIRKAILDYYPDEVRRRKIAREAALIAQSGQYNYGRMSRRGDSVTAHIALSEFLNHTMMMIYLLNRRYAPFYKWMYRGLQDEPVLNNVRSLLAKLSECKVHEEQIPVIIEKIVAMIIAEMKKQGLTAVNYDYLDAHTESIIKMIDGPVDGEESSKMAFSMKEELVDQIVKMEWKAFDKVKNEGGRASCQNDLYTFTIMRKSQYLTWNEDMLKTYIHDFNQANDAGWNLITEKYGRMMESTAYDKWLEIKDSFPVISDEKKEIIESIVAIQVSWMEEFAKEYPKAAGNARSIHSYEDHEYNTSYETYLRGEISTYSDEMLALYGRFIAILASEGENLAFITMKNTANLYGYKDLDELEEKCS